MGQKQPEERGRGSIEILRMRSDHVIRATVSLHEKPGFPLVK